MRKFIHQNYEVIDVFSFMDDNDIEKNIKDKLISLFGKAFPYQYFGNIESIINKVGTVVHLAIKTYKVTLDERHKVLDSYMDDVVKSGDSVFWLHKDEIKNEKRIREGDKKILVRIFDDRNVDIKIVENQGNRWIDAKTIVFENR